MSNTATPHSRHSSSSTSQPHPPPSLASAAPYDFESSTLHLLQQQQDVLQQHHASLRHPQQHQEKQKQYVKEVVTSLRFSGQDDESEEEQKSQTTAASMMPNTMMQNRPPSKKRHSHHQPHPPQPRPPPTTTSQSRSHLDIASQHSSFLIQDRIHFFEKYAVQPRIVATGEGGSEKQDPINSLLSTESMINPKTGKPYGSRLGNGNASSSSSGAQTDRREATAPVSARTAGAASTARSHRAHKPRVSNFSKSSRFTPDATSSSSCSSARAPSNSHVQFGVATNLPNYFSALTSAGVHQPEVGEAEDEHASSSSAQSKQAAHQAPISNGLGGYILDHSMLGGGGSGGGHSHTVAGGVSNISTTSGRPTGTISMSEHCHIVNQALQHKTTELLRIYQQKIQAETQRMEQQEKKENSAQRKELNKIITSYLSKLNDISSHYTHLSSSQSQISSLSLSNASMRVYNLELARTYDSELQDMKYELEVMRKEQQQQQQQMPQQQQQGSSFGGNSSKRRSQEMSGSSTPQLNHNSAAADASSTSSTALISTSPSTAISSHTYDQLSTLTKHVELKLSEKTRLQTEIASLKEQLSLTQPLLEEEIRKVTERFREVTQNISDAQSQKEKMHEKQRAEIEELKEQIRAKNASNTVLNSRIFSLKKTASHLRNTITHTEAKVLEAKRQYDEEMEKGTKELETLRSNLDLKSQAYRTQRDSISHSIQVCAQLENQLKIDLICSTCMCIYERPMILWPCGHTLCENCVTQVQVKEEATGSEGTTNEASPSRPDTAPAPPTSSSPPPSSLEPQPRGATGNTIYICTECQHNYDHPDTTSQDDNEHHIDLSYPNPFFDPPPNFSGRFYVIPNMVIAKLVEMYHTNSAKLEEMVKKFQETSKEVDVFEPYLNTTAAAPIASVNEKLIEEERKE